MFFSPIKGEITQSFNFNENHFAIDIAADIGTPVKSVLDGKIIFSEWSLETGYVVVIDHGENIISVYKHNSKTLKEQKHVLDADFDMIEKEVKSQMGQAGMIESGEVVDLEQHRIKKKKWTPKLV